MRYVQRRAYFYVSTPDAGVRVTDGPGVLHVYIRTTCYPGYISNLHPPWATFRYPTSYRVYEMLRHCTASLRWHIYLLTLHPSLC